MADLEKVIKGLECAIGIRGMKNCDNCPYDDDFNCLGCDVLLLRDALELLKAQMPRVLEFDELEDTIADRAVWYEAFLTEVPTIAIVCEKSIADDAYTIVDFISGRHRVTRRTYGAAWRCWNTRPTDEQRKVTQWTWNEPPKEEV